MTTFMMFVKRLNETNYLLRGGFASSALDRVRGMYEIGVYLEIVLKNDEDLAEKFLKHANTTRLDIARSLSDETMSQRIIDEINDFNDDEFYRRNNGWAKKIFRPNTNITFKKLAEKTELAQYYFMYKLACQSVHASIIESLNGIELCKDDKGKSIWVTGPSEYGVEKVIEILANSSYGIILKYFDQKNLSNAFLLIFFREIIKNK